jgi:hypothetical protein
MSRRGFLGWLLGRGRPDRPVDLPPGIPSVLERIDRNPYSADSGREDER